MKAKLPTAAERTPSLFTGQTDLEGGGFARDGSSPNSEARPKRAPPRLKWEGGFTEWWVEGRDASKTKTHLIRKRADGYHAFAKGKTLGVFETIHEAGAACEEA